MEKSTYQGTGRPRDGKIRQRILAAALQIIRDSGYTELSIKRIADAADVNRQTIYRWWRTKGEVVLEAVVEQVREQEALGSSLENFLRETFALGRGPIGEAVVGIMADAQRDQRLHARLKEQLIGMRRALLRKLLMDDAAAHDTDYIVPVDIIVDMLFGAMWYRLLDRHVPLTDDFATELAEAAAQLTKIE